MAVTIVKQPLSVVPAHNDIEWQATSTQYTQPDFAFYVTVTVVSYSITLNFKIAPVNNDRLYFNLIEITRKYVSNYYPFQVYGWQTATDAIQEFTVNIGEYYSGTVHAGSDETILAYNASLTKEERRLYQPSLYEVTGTKNNDWLNNLYNGSATNGRTSCKINQDFVFYFLETGARSVELVTITTYDSSNTLLGTSVISNSFDPPSSTATKHLCINLGPSGLDNIDSGAVTGTYPIITSSVASYMIAFRIDNGTGYNYFYRYVDIDRCAPKFEKVTVHYLNRKGAYDFYNFYGNHQKSLNINKSVFSGITERFEGSYDLVGTGTIYPNSPIAPNKKTLEISYETIRVLRSQYLSDFEIEALQDLITSPDIIIQTDEKLYLRVTSQDLNYRFKNIGEKQQILEITLNEGFTERRQRG